MSVRKGFAKCSLDLNLLAPEGLSDEMRLRSDRKPFKRVGFSTVWMDVPVSLRSFEPWAALVLFVLAAAATLTIWSRDPMGIWGFTLGACALGCACNLCLLLRRPFEALSGYHLVLSGNTLACLALSGLAVWGAVQLLIGATEYRYATLERSVQAVGLVATAAVANFALASSRLRLRFLRGFSWFSIGLSTVAVLAYFISPNLILWWIPSPYPDVWGPFLSRNDFAGFLELGLPVTLWLGLEKNQGGWYLLGAGWILAAGLASASRAGSLLLITEAVVICLITRHRPAVPKFLLSTVLFVGIAGAGTLWKRFADPDPFLYRREIASSTIRMIAARPLRGFGLGTFSHVYPAYATFDAGARVEHAHNEWLEWAAEGGIVYAGLWFVLAAAIAAPALRSTWALGVPAAFLHAAVDYPFTRPGLTAWSFTLIGALLAARHMRDRVGSPAHSPGDLRY
jgi:hypothetical protein